MPMFLPIFPFFKPKIIPSVIVYEGVTSCASRASPLDEAMKKVIVLSIPGFTHVADN